MGIAVTDPWLLGQPWLGPEWFSKYKYLPLDGCLIINLKPAINHELRNADLSFAGKNRCGLLHGEPFLTTLP